jgi:hypothetical protein
MIRAWFSQTAGGSCEAQSSPKPRFASHRAKAVPSEKLLVLKGLTGLSGVVEARQKGVVDHNDPAVFSGLAVVTFAGDRPAASPSFRGAPLGANPESRAEHGAGFRVCAQEGASRNDANTAIYGDVCSVPARLKPARRCKDLYRSAFTS